jgi:hypothetical protein
MKLEIDKLITVDESGMPKAPNPKQLLDKDILKLYSRDNTPDKRKYIGDCGVIYYLGDPKGPCKQRGLSDAECIQEAIENFNLDADYKPDDLVWKIAKRYYKQNITEAGVTIENLNKALHVCNLAADRIIDYLNNKLRGVIAPEDIPTVLGMISNVSGQVKAIPDLVKSLRVAYDNLATEEEVKIARGGIQILSSMDADEED